MSIFFSYLQVNGAKGTVTTRVQIPGDAQGPFKWNAYLAPQNENWPNSLASTSFETEFGAKVVNACAPVKNSAHPTADVPDFNYVVLANYPGGFVAGAKTPVTVQYNYQGAEPATITTSLKRNSDDSVIATVTKDAEQGEHTLRMPLDVPREIGPDPVYLTTDIIPVGKDATESVAQDRAWSTSIQYQRLLRSQQ